MDVKNISYKFRAFAQSFSDDVEVVRPGKKLPVEIVTQESLKGQPIKLEKPESDGNWWEKAEPPFESEEEYNEAWAKELRPMESHAIERYLISEQVKKEDFPDLVELTIEGKEGGYWAWFNNRYNKIQTMAQVSIPGEMLNEDVRPSTSRQDLLTSSSDILALSKKFAAGNDTILPPPPRTPLGPSDSAPFTDLTPEEQMLMSIQQNELVENEDLDTEFPPPNHFTGREISETMPSPDFDAPKSPRLPIEIAPSAREALAFLKEKPEVLSKFLKALHSETKGKYIHLFIDGHSVGVFNKIQGEESSGITDAHPSVHFIPDNTMSGIVPLEVGLPSFESWLQANDKATWEKYNEIKDW